MQRRNSMDEPRHMTIMLLGSTGAGKSASGNTILNRAEHPFEEDFSPEAVTRTCQSEQTEVDGQTITVIDTVGLSDTEVKITDAQTQIQWMVQWANDGIDVFLLVIKLDETFTKNDSNVVTWIRENFGAKVLKHTIVLFTHGDQLHVPVERYVNKSEALRSVVDQCSGGFHVFNNKDKDQSQVPELLEKIESLRIKNAYKRYTLQDYKKTQKDILLKKAAGTAVGGEAAGGGTGGEEVGGEAGGGEAAGGAAGGTRGGEAAAAAAAASAAAAGAAAVATKLGVAVTALTVTVGTGGVAVVAAAAAGAGVYLMARKAISKTKEKK